MYIADYSERDLIQLLWEYKIYHGDKRLNEVNPNTKLIEVL
jgi:hypothetical protein